MIKIVIAFTLATLTPNITLLFGVNLFFNVNIFFHLLQQFWTTHLNCFQKGISIVNAKIHFTFYYFKIHKQIKFDKIILKII